MDTGDTIDWLKGGKADKGQSAQVHAYHTGTERFKEDTRSTNRLPPPRGRQAQIPRIFQQPPGIPTTTLKSSSNYLDNPEDKIAQHNYHTSTSEVCGEGVFSPDNASPSLSSRHEGNAPEPVSCGGYSGSSLMASGDQKPQDHAAIVNHTRASAGQHCHKLSESLDIALVVSGNVVAEDVKDARVQPTNNSPSSVKQQPSHVKLPFRPILKPKLQNSQRSFDETPSYANSRKETTKRYDESSNVLRAPGEAGDGVSVLSKHQHSRLLDVPSSPALATGQAAPKMLSAPIDKAGIGSWVSDVNFSDTKPHFPDHLDLLHPLFHDERQRNLTQFGSEASGSNSGQSECRLSKGASGTSQNGTAGKRKRSIGGGGNGEVPNDENDDGDDSSQRTSNKISAEYLKKGLACPFYKNDPVYFANDLFHDGKFFICAARGFPNIARLKEHMYRKHSLPHTCSRCGDIFKNKSALDNHLPVRNPEKFTCEIRTLPPSKTKGLTPDMEGELKKRSKNGATPTAEAIWIDIYKRLFPGDPMPPSGPYLTDSHGSSCGSYGSKEREEYIQYSEQELPGLIQDELDARGCVAPEHRDLLILVVKLCQKKLPGMFQVRETSGARLASADGSPESISQPNEIVREMMSCSTPPAQDPFRPYSKILNCGLEDPSPRPSQFRENSTSSPDLLSICHDSGYDSPSRGSKSICDHSRSGSDPAVERSSPHSALAGDLLFNTFQPSASQESMGPIGTADPDYFWPLEWQALYQSCILEDQKSQTSSYIEEPTAAQYILR